MFFQPTLETSVAHNFRQKYTSMHNGDQEQERNLFHENHPTSFDTSYSPNQSDDGGVAVAEATSYGDGGDRDPLTQALGKKMKWGAKNTLSKYQKKQLIWILQKVKLPEEPKALIKKLLANNGIDTADFNFRPREIEEFAITESDKETPLRYILNSIDRTIAAAAGLIKDISQHPADFIQKLQEEARSILMDEALVDWELNTKNTDPNKIWLQEINGSKYACIADPESPKDIMLILLDKMPSFEPYLSDEDVAEFDKRAEDIRLRTVKNYRDYKLYHEGKAPYSSA